MGYVFRERWTLVSLMIINMIGFFIGIYYYMDEFAVHPSFIWVIVADCPLAVLLFSWVCYLYLRGKRIPNLLLFFTSVYMIKYGLWTLSAIYLYWNHYLSGMDQIIAILNFILHTGLILEGVALSGKVKMNRDNTLMVIGMVLLNDFFDYFLGTLQNMPSTHVGTLMIESFAVSIALPLIIYLSARRRKRSHYRSPSR